jgi:hypothetical protein
MQLKNFYSKLATLFDKNFGSPELNLDNVKTETQEWINYYYSNPLYRHIHLEYYNAKKIEVVHVNHFPNPLTDLPIFGLDIIALNGKITGFFMDFTPTVYEHPSLDHLLLSFDNDLALSKRRDLPEWADFFGSYFLCITPHIDEIDKVFENTLEVVDTYLQYINVYYKKYQKNIKIQNSYCEGQKKNDKTFKALSIDIGVEKAKSFMENCLFPEIK